MAIFLDKFCSSTRGLDLNQYLSPQMSLTFHSKIRLHQFEYKCSYSPKSKAPSPVFIIFEIFQAVRFGTSLSPRTLIFYGRCSYMYSVSRVVRLFNQSKYWATNQSNTNQMFVKSGLWSGVLTEISYTYHKGLKLVLFLDMTKHSKFGKIRRHM